MKTVSIKLTIMLVALVVLLGLVVSCSQSEVMEKPAEMKEQPAGTLKTGGLLYDNWPKMVGAKLDGSHPLYPSEGKKPGGSSWRCKECHGWDYIGDKGRYSKGSHYTGIKGVLDSAGNSPDDLYRILSGGTEKHDFSEWMSAEQIKSLALFINEGLVDMRNHIDSEGMATGDSDNGKKLYEANCSSCHGTDGNKLDFKSDKEGVQGIGWLANDNPQESLHKIRWGHPGSAMPSMVVDKGLSASDSADILTYSQTLK